MDFSKVPALHQLLQCLSLRDAVKIIGWIFLTGHIVGIMESPFSNLWLYINCDIIEFYAELDDTGSHRCPDWLKNHLLYKVVADFGLSIAEIGTSFLLLLGVYQKIPRYIKQWVVIEAILLFIDIILTNGGFLTEFVVTNRISSILYYICKCVEVLGILTCYKYYRTVEAMPASNII